MSETVFAGTVGKLEEFDPKSDTMTAYIEREMLFFLTPTTYLEIKELLPSLVLWERILFRYFAI